MTAQTQVTVQDKANFGGFVVNPSAKDAKDGGVVYTIPASKVIAAARKSGIEKYVYLLENGKRLGMRSNNKVLVPALRALKPNKDDAKPGNEVNAMTTTEDASLADRIKAAQDLLASLQAEVNGGSNNAPKTDDANQRKLEALARGRETAKRNREAKKNGKVENANTTLVLSSEDASTDRTPRLPESMRNVYLNLIRMGELEEAQKFFDAEAI